MYQKPVQATLRTVTLMGLEEEFKEIVKNTSVSLMKVNTMAKES
jgi:hypothetical protein